MTVGVVPAQTNDPEFSRFLMEVLRAGFGEIGCRRDRKQMVAAIDAEDGRVVRVREPIFECVKNWQEVVRSYGHCVRLGI
ncbi:hypothetical protein EGK76_00290 [Luteimonas sp. 100069]|nr:hypothetical protein EGK76_00290 [Luteimonas sp. 100069]